MSDFEQQMEELFDLEENKTKKSRFKFSETLLFIII